MSSSDTPFRYMLAFALLGTVCAEAHASMYDGLVGHWTFDDRLVGSPMVASDATGSGNRGSPVNMDSVTDWVSGRVGGALAFDGLDDYVITTANMLSGFSDTSLSIALWFKARQGGVMVSEHEQSSLGVGWHNSQIEILGTGEVKVGVWSGTHVVASLGTVAFDEWHHLVLRFNSATSTLDGFIDGIEAIADTSGLRSAPTELYFAFGAIESVNLGDGTYFDGLLDDIRIYNRAITSSEIDEIIYFADGGTGRILRERWTGTSGSNQNDLINTPAYPHSPNIVDYITCLQDGRNWADGYGTRMRGYLHPPETGDYVFALSADDSAELFLSSDENPANMTVVIAPGASLPFDVWTGDSASRPLTAGNKYYIEFRFKEDQGDDFARARWKRTTWPSYAEPIPGTYLSPVQQDDLIAHWKLDEAAGDAMDSSGNDLRGTVNGGPVWQTAGGHIDGAIDLDGTDDYLSTNKMILNNLAQFTIAGWINTSALNGRRDLWGQDNTVEFAINESTLFLLTAATPIIETNYSAYAGGWHHVAAVGTGLEVLLYVDAVELARHTASVANYGSGGNFNIGSATSDAVGNFFDGTMDDIRAYKRGLSAEDIANLVAGTEHRYWVGGSGEWSQTGHWSETPLGPPGATPPDSSQIAVFGPAPEFPTCTLDRNIDVAGIQLSHLPGLVGQFYDGSNRDAFMGTYVDPLVNFSDANSVIGDLRCGGNDYFSERWTGFVKADYSETYTFYVNSDDGARLWIDGQLVVDRWGAGGGIASGGKALVAGQWYSLTLEHFEIDSSAFIQLQYESPSQSRIAVPTTNLRTSSVALDQNSFEITVGTSGFTQSWGRFMGDGNLSLYGPANVTGGAFELVDGAYATVGDGLALAFGSESSLAITGTPGNEIQIAGTGSYGMDVGGNIDISYAHFRGLASSGLVLSGSGGAAVSMSNALFRVTQGGAGSAHLRISGTDWDLYTFDSFSFDDSTDNAVEITSGGTVTFDNFDTSANRLYGDDEDLQTNGTVNWTGGIPPRVTSVVTGDCNVDGKIDYLILTFDMQVDVIDGNTADGFPAVSVLGYSIANGDYGTFNTSTLFLILVEGSIPDTDATPDVVFDNSGNGNPVTATTGALPAADYASTPARDGVGPVIVSAQTITQTSVELTFSESVADGTFAPSDVEFAGFATAGANGPGAAFDTGAAANDEVVIITLASTIGADETGTVSFTATRVVDDNASPANGNFQTSTVLVLDGIGLQPRILSAVTGDANADGWLDQLVITFDAPVDITDGNGGDGFPPIELGSGYTIANQDYTANDVTILTLQLTGRATPDTDAVFRVTFTNGGEVVHGTSGVTAASASLTTSDGAGPAIVSAQTLTSGTAMLFLSEAVHDSTFAGWDVTFSNFATGGANAAGVLLDTGDTANDRIVIIALPATVGTDETGRVQFSDVDLVYDEAAPPNGNAQTAAIDVIDGVGTTPSIVSFVADDPDDGDIAYGPADTITVLFDVATNTPATVTGQGIDAAGMGSAFTVTNGSWGDSTDTYNVSWTDPRTLQAVVVSVGGATLSVGSTTISLESAANVRDYSEAAATSTSTSPALTGDWGLALPGAFRLIRPADGRFPAAIAPAFSWTASSNAATYALLVDDDAALSSPIINEPALSTTLYESATEVLAAGSTYYWRVTAVNPNGSTVASNADITFNVSPNATSLDWDGDGIANDHEILIDTDPRYGDTDFDEMPDPWELANGTDPTVPDGNGDLDDDGISNLDEFLDGTDPRHNNYPGITGGTASCAAGGAAGGAGRDSWVAVVLLWALVARRRLVSSARAVER